MKHVLLISALFLTSCATIPPAQETPEMAQKRIERQEKTKRVVKAALNLITFILIRRI